MFLQFPPNNKTMMTVNKLTDSFLHLETAGKITTINRKFIGTIIPDRPSAHDPKKRCYHLVLTVSETKAQRDFGFYSNRFELTESAGKHLQELLD
jgi:hypothetical protein